MTLFYWDIMIPRKWGFDVLREIREVSEVPIIFLTAVTSEQYELEALECGADDYIKKPFKLDNLEMKIKMVLRRTIKETKEENNNSLQINNGQKIIIENGREIQATDKEIEVLQYFMNHKGQVISREKLLNKVWGIDYIGTERTVDTVIKQLRAKLKDKKYIYTVIGVGYKYED